MPLSSAVNSVVKRLPIIRDVVAERDQLRRDGDQLRRDSGFVPAGHFYSPIPHWDDIARDQSRIFGAGSRTFPGIDLRETEQLALLETLSQYYPSMPFPNQKIAGQRYFFENTAYSYSDAILLHCLIRHLKPRRIVEIGSGHSTCAMLDTNELFFDGSIEVTCIEPYPELLLSLIDAEDAKRITILPQRLQDVDPDVFRALEANDILFVDSTHVSKVDSDVNRVFFEILPSLSRSVHVHFHDVFFPFEYPKEWVLGGRAWNEMYMLRAFLQFNAGFSVVLMNTFMEHFHEAFFREHMPLCLKNPGGSIWIRRE